MNKYIDAHCHIGDGTWANSIATFFCNSVTPDDWHRLLMLSDTNDVVYPCLGVHPWYVDALPAQWDAHLCQLLSQTSKAMVGEIGLDKTRPHYDIQRDVFRRCMNIAAEYQRAVHIHCVRAWGDMIDTICNMSHLPPVIVFHSFTASHEIMRQVQRMKSRVYFSYSDAASDPRHRNMRACAEITPLSQILIESDGPMATSESVLARAADEIATIKNIPVERLVDAVYNNAQMVIKNG